MSIDYYNCDNCGTTFPDCGYYVTCESCWTKWCDDECAEKGGYVPEHCKKYESYDRDEMENHLRIEKNCGYEDCCYCPEYEPDSCKYCRGEDYLDETLLETALELLKMSREDLVAIVNSKNQEEKL